MLVGLLTTLFVFMCLFMVLLILIQKGKGGMGLGSLGGSSQMLFGGSGGQDMFQKMTWILGAIFIFGSLGLSMLKSREYSKSRYAQTAPVRATPQQTPGLPDAPK